MSKFKSAEQLSLNNASSVGSASLHEILTEDGTKSKIGAVLSTIVMTCVATFSLPHWSVTLQVLTISELLGQSPEMVDSKKLVEKFPQLSCVMMVSLGIDSSQEIVTSEGMNPKAGGVLSDIVNPAVV